MTIENINLNKNKKYSLKKNLSIRITMLIVAGTLAVTGLVSVLTKKTRLINETTNKVVAFYGEDSKEKKIVDYIGISEKLAKLDLESYYSNVYLGVIQDTVKGLDSVENINLAIQKFEEAMGKGYTVDQIEELYSYLNNQELRVNEYIYSVGYKVANEDVTKASKEYAETVYGVDADSIKFVSSGVDPSYEIVDTSNEHSNIRVSNSDIKDGIESMNATNINDDHNPSDNKEYNADRNSNILEALKDSADLKEKASENGYEYNSFENNKGIR